MQDKKEQHPLQRDYHFWFSKSKENKKGMSKEDFESELKSLKTFSTVEEFWGLFLHMKTPSQLETGSKVFLFQSSIRPLWEDEMNKNGGRFYIRVRKDKSDKLWQDLCLAYISEDFDYNNQICGLQLAARPDNVTVVSVWTQYIKHYIKEELTNWLRDYLDIPSRLRIEYQDHPRSNDGGYKGRNHNWDRGYRRKY